MNRLYCNECFKKDLLIDQLKEENARLHQQLRHQQRSQSEGVFGSSTPSSKNPFKKVSAPENQHKRGGARKGHRGNGRKSFTQETADEVIDVETSAHCPDCGTQLHKTGFRERSVLDIEPVKIKTVVYRLQECICPHCKKKVRAKSPGVLAHSFYSNKLISYLATEHYLHRVPINHLAQRLGLSLGSVIGAFHRLANVLQKVPENLMKEYRRAVVKHADETSWRNDGRNGYAWLFATQQITLLLLRTTRSALVVREVLGTKQLPGYLVVDRYAGYNKSPCRIQYCYAHLLRDVQDIIIGGKNACKLN